MQLRERVRSTMEDIVHVALDGRTGDRDRILTEKAAPTDFACYQAALASFTEKCFKFSEVMYIIVFDVPWIM